MMRMIVALLRNTRGVSAVEFALTAPLVIMLIVGTLNIGTYIFAQNSVSNATDHVGREAAVYPTPSDNELQSIFADAILKQESDVKVSLAIQHGSAANGTKYVDLSTSYMLHVDLLFLSLGTLPVSADRRVYLPS